MPALDGAMHATLDGWRDANNTIDYQVQPVQIEHYHIYIWTLLHSTQMSTLIARFGSQQKSARENERAQLKVRVELFIFHTQFQTLSLIWLEEYVGTDKSSIIKLYFSVSMGVWCHGTGVKNDKRQKRQSSAAHRQKSMWARQTTKTVFRGQGLSQDISVS